MEVTGVGSTYSYIYNGKTKKLSTMDGQEDNFTKYFNGDSSEEVLKELNYYDSGKRADLNSLIMLFSEGGGDEIIFDGEVRISCCRGKSLTRQPAPSVWMGTNTNH